MALASVALAVSACGGGSSARPGGADIPKDPVTVSAPDLTLEGCTYMVNNSVPPGEPKGIKPDFASFSPDAAASAALRSIEDHGGQAMVDGTGVPAGTHLYAGPDLSGAPVGTVPPGHSVIVAEPLVWKDATGDTWLAFFITCGGEHLYWASVGQIRKQNPVVGGDIASLIEQLRSAPPFTSSGQASFLPVTVEHHRLAWTSSHVSFPVGRGQLIANVT